jgi:hypothetical protein
MATADLTKRFHQKMLQIYERAAKECHYRPIRFLQMVPERAGLAAAKELLRADKPAEGLTRLWELGRLDISMEALVCEEPWRSLFTADEVAVAEKRLRDLDFRESRSPNTMEHSPHPRKKLIEVALPLEAINAASAREKSIRRGHPSTLHLWWARRPLAACRAVLFAQLVDDPSSWPERFPSEEAQGAERKRLHDFIAELVQWENSNNERVLNKARWYIARSLAWGRGEEPPDKNDPEAVRKYLLQHAPPVYDPFCGGGSIPLEAQRLGLRAYGSDLNPVAVMISKALVEFPPKFAGLPPVNPEARKKLSNGGAWNAKGAQGLAEDVRYYGRWMHDEAKKRIGHLYPKARITSEVAEGRPDLQRLVGEELTVVAWLWARTVASSNPAARGHTCRWSRALCSRPSLARKPGRAGARFGRTGRLPLRAPHRQGWPDDTVESEKGHPGIPRCQLRLPADRYANNARAYQG